MDRLLELGVDTAITFNYDIHLELGYFENIPGGHIEYCLDADRIPRDENFRGTRQPSNVFTMLKPHGSVNWFENDTEIKYLRPEYLYTNLDTNAYESTSLGEHISVSIDGVFRKCVSHVEDSPQSYRPILAAPTRRKAPPAGSNFQPNKIFEIMREKILSADELWVVGYSFPTSDQSVKGWFKSIFSKAYPPKIRVFDLYPQAVAKNILKIVGPSFSRAIQIYGDPESGQKFEDIDWSSVVPL